MEANSEFRHPTECRDRVSPLAFFVDARMTKFGAQDEAVLDDLVKTRFAHVKVKGDIRVTADQCRQWVSKFSPGVTVDVLRMRLRRALMRKCGLNCRGQPLRKSPGEQSLDESESAEDDQEAAQAEQNSLCEDNPLMSVQQLDENNSHNDGETDARTCKRRTPDPKFQPTVAQEPAPFRSKSGDTEAAQGTKEGDNRSQSRSGRNGRSSSETEDACSSKLPLRLLVDSVRLCRQHIMAHTRGRKWSLLQLALDDLIAAISPTRLKSRKRMARVQARAEAALYSPVSDRQVVHRYHFLTLSSSIAAEVHAALKRVETLLGELGTDTQSSFVVSQLQSLCEQVRYSVVRKGSALLQLLQERSNSDLQLSRTNTI
ncbi:MAG: hypothetical protein MHM6MM_001101 [Cercozoa sp. M6MM]